MFPQHLRFQCSNIFAHILREGKSVFCVVRFFLWLDVWNAFFFRFGCFIWQIQTNKKLALVYFWLMDFSFFLIMVIFCSWCLMCMILIAPCIFINYNIYQLYLTTLYKFTKYTFFWLLRLKISFWPISTERKSNTFCWMSFGKKLLVRTRSHQKVLNAYAAVQNTRQRIPIKSFRLQFKLNVMCFVMVLVCVLYFHF